MTRLQRVFRDLARYPSAIVGLVIIAGLLIVAVYAVISIPYSEAIRLWRGGDEVVRENPRNARPVWANLFSRAELPRTIVLSSRDGSAEKSTEVLPGAKDVTITFTFDFPYDDFPQEIIVFFTAQYAARQPHVEMAWLTPDGRSIRVGDISPRWSDAFRFALDTRLVRRLGGQVPQVALFANPDPPPARGGQEGVPVPLKGTYQLQVSGLVFEEEGDVDAQLVVYGQVHGLGGTDHRRRDLMVALLWGTPVALAFGLLAALGSTVTTMVIAAIGVWFGGAVDATIQRITEVNLILPVLPILIMVGTLYSRSIWIILGLVILLSIFGSSIKTFRAIFLQVKESPYIEAAQAYGAGNWRVILHYLVPRIVPLLVPQLVVLVPTFVFLEASLAVLGLGDPVLPTWGKVINDANSQGALFNRYYYWVLEPAALLMLTGLGFTMVGFALDRIFNPRLRDL
ncbi:MAG: ABC transporter permease [Chloroflexi bacterium]|nr:ABC transporter permease [Chloroflexota bacterium]